MDHYAEPLPMSTGTGADERDKFGLTTNALIARRQQRNALLGTSASRVRDTDPATSHAAAAHVGPRVAGQQVTCLRAYANATTTNLVALGGLDAGAITFNVGLTDYELHMTTRMNRGSAAKRRQELEAMGAVVTRRDGEENIVTRRTDTGRYARVFVITPLGRTLLAEYETPTEGD